MESDSDIMKTHIGDIFEEQVLTADTAHSLLAAKRKGQAVLCACTIHCCVYLGF